MSQRPPSEKRTIKYSVYDEYEGVTIRIILVWNDVNDEEDTAFTFGYEAVADQGERILVAGSPESKSYRKLLSSANEPTCKGANLLLYMPCLPQVSIPASLGHEVEVWVPFEGKQNFRDFLQAVARDFPPDEDNLVPRINDDGPSPKDRIN